jgi:hypothetical protein
MLIFKKTNNLQNNFLIVNIKEAYVLIRQHKKVTGKLFILLKFWENFKKRPNFASPVYILFKIK